MRVKVKDLLSIFFIGFCIVGLHRNATANIKLPIQEIISISAAKIDNDSNFIPDRLGDTVSVAGRVSVESGILWADRFQIAIQDPTAGIFVFSFDNKWPKISLGDSIQITGIIDQYRGLTQIINPEISFIDTVNRKTINPILLEEHSFENNESKIVTITSSIIQKKYNSGGSYLMVAPPEGFDQPLMIFNPNSHKFPHLLEKYKVGEKIKITGLLFQHDYNKRPDGDYQILPLSSKNIVLKQFSVLFYLYLIGAGILISLSILIFNILLRKKVKNRTKQLKESENRFSDLTESTSSAILILLGNQFVYANQAIEKVSGFSKSDILFKPIHELMKIDENKLVRVKQCKKTFRAESQFSLSNNNKIWLDYTIAPINWNNKDASIITAVDVTSQKQAELKAELSENRFQFLANSAPVGIFRNRANGDITYVNPKWSELSGMSAEKALRQGWMEAIHPEYREMLGDRWNETKNENKATIKEYCFLHQNGKEIWVMSQATPEYDASKKIIGYVGSITDITELKNAEKLLKISEEKFRNIFENHSAIKMIIDPLTGDIEDANQSAADYYGLSREEIKNKGIHEVNFIPKKLILGELQKINGGKQNMFEINHPREDGSISDVEVFSSKTKINGKTFLYCIIQDVTEKKRLFNELIVAKNKAEENDRLKTAFLNNISHELRTPMNGILGFSELLRKPNIGNDKRDQFLRVIEKSGQRMLNTITEIVEISKIETKQIELDIKKTNLNKIIIDLYNSHKPEADSKNLKLLYQSGLPDDQAMIKTDSYKLSQILSHLLTNAIKFTESGSIEFGYKIINERIEFYVSDTGIGLTPEYQENLFNSFTQGSTAYTRDYEGLGLGLSISLAYVELFGGKINIESELGKGASFLFDIPYLKEEEEGVNSSIIEKPKNSSLSNPILIVEDEPTSMQFLSIILKNEKLNLLYATNGEEAIEMIKNHSDINIVLMDLKMPGIDGFETTKRIKALNPNLRIIAQTAFAFETDKEKAFNAGCDEYITKPIKKDLLMEKIQSFLN